MLTKNVKSIPVGLSLLVNGEKVVLELQDNISRITFVYAEFSTSEFCAALGRLCCVPITCEVRDLHHVGKKMIMDRITFPLPNDESKSSTKLALQEEPKYVPEGWVADGSFSSRGSFEVKDGITYANDIIRTWVDEDKK